MKTPVKFLPFLLLAIMMPAVEGIAETPPVTDEAEITFTDEDGSGKPDPELGKNPPMKVMLERDGDHIAVFLVNLSET